MKSMKLTIFLGILVLSFQVFGQAFGQGSTALTVIQGETGRALINKAIQNNPAAREFFAGVLGIKAEKLVAMDPALRQTQLISRLNAEGPDQQSLVRKAIDFTQTTNTAKTSAADLTLGGSASSEEVFGGKLKTQVGGKKTIPLPPAASTTTTTSGVKSEPMLVQFTNQLVDRGEITDTMGTQFQSAVTTTDVEGRDVVRCITRWQQPANRALYVKTIIAGSKLLPDGKAALGAITDTISRELGVSPEEARRRACALAGAGNISCNAYGEPILRACL